MHFYHTYGLRIGSDILLPELSIMHEQTIDITIQFGQLSMPALATRKPKKHFSITMENACLFWDRVGLFSVRNGRKVIIDPQPGVEEQLIRQPILGPVMASLLHQRGLLVLHASAVAINGGAIAFVGGKGWGKSTLAAALCARGYGLVADDIVALGTSKMNVPTLLPGFPRLKLWPDAVVALGDDPNKLPRLWSQIEKRGWQTQNGFSKQEIPLKQLYVLGRGSSAEIKQLSRQDALKRLLDHNYIALLDKKWLESSATSHFMQCVELVKRIPVYRLSRPRSHDLLPEITRLIEAHVHK